MKSRRKIVCPRRGTSLKVVLFCLTTLPPVSAQYSGLSVTDDGRQLYFGSSLRLKGTDEHEQEKIFRYNVDLFEQFASSPELPLSQPQTSGDGRVVVYQTTRFCSFGSPECFTGLNRRNFVKGADVPAALTTSGELLMSPNGRYFLHLPLFGSTGEPILYDGVQGTSTVLPSPKLLNNGRQALANDGSVLFELAGRPVLWRAGVTTPLTLSQPPIRAAISADASTVVYESAVIGDVRRLFVYNVASSRETLLTEGPLATGPPSACMFCPPPAAPPPPMFFPNLSNNGRLVFYRIPSAEIGEWQAVIQPADGSMRRVLPSDMPVLESVLSGDGSVAFLISRRGLVRVEVSTGSARTLLDNPMIVYFGGSRPVPGGLTRITGQRLVNTDGTLNVQLEEGAWTVLEASSTSLLLQAPWDLPLSRPVTFTVSAPEHPFEQVVRQQSVPAAPVIFQSEQKREVVFHEDFRGPVTSQDPASPGEIVHVYATNLGAVTPPIATGTPAPANVLHRVVASLSCSAGVVGPWQEVPVALLFAGLAPGTIGIYQMDVQLPVLSPAPRAVDLKCGVPDFTDSHVQTSVLMSSAENRTDVSGSLYPD